MSRMKTAMIVFGVLVSVFTLGVASLRALASEGQSNDEAAHRLAAAERYAQLVTAHDSERAEAGWSDSKTNEVSLRMSALGLADGLRIDCRATYCRVEGHWGDSGAPPDSFVDVWMRSEPCEFHVPDLSLIEGTDAGQFVVFVRCPR